jgi:hypothetical protein
MPKAKILSIYVLVDLAIVAFVVWGVFHRWPVGQYFIPAAVAFVLAGIWLIVMTVRHTPPGVS